jgi:hypothetical protein
MKIFFKNINDFLKTFSRIFQKYSKNISPKVITKVGKCGSCYLLCTHRPLENKKSTMEKNLDPKIHKGVEVEPCTHDKPPKKSQDWPQNKLQTPLGKKNQPWKTTSITKSTRIWRRNFCPWQATKKSQDQPCKKITTTFEKNSTMEISRFHLLFNEH